MAEFVTEHPVLTVTRTASGAVTGRRFVGLDDAQAVTGATVLGVAAADAADAEPMAVVVVGTVAVEAGAAISKGAEVASNGVGKAITAVSTYVIAGHALSLASTDGDMIELKLGASPVKS